jgi:hypothetical protein
MGVYIMINQDEFIQNLKIRLEASKSFKYWNKAIGLSFDDFEILELNNGIPLKKGKRDIGVYEIFLKGGVIDSVAYDMNNKKVNEYELKELENVM